VVGAGVGVAVTRERKMTKTERRRKILADTVDEPLGREDAIIEVNGA